MEVFALGLALKPRRKATRKWAGSRFKHKYLALSSRCFFSFFLFFLEMQENELPSAITKTLLSGSTRRESFHLSGHTCRFSLTYVSTYSKDPSPSLWSVIQEHSSKFRCCCFHSVLPVKEFQSVWTLGIDANTTFRNKERCPFRGLTPKKTPS